MSQIHYVTKIGSDPSVSSSWEWDCRSGSLCTACFECFAFIVFWIWWHLKKFLPYGKFDASLYYVERTCLKKIRSNKTNKKVLGNYLFWSQKWVALSWEHKFGYPKSHVLIWWQFHEIIRVTEWRIFQIHWWKHQIGELEQRKVGRTSAMGLRCHLLTFLDFRLVEASGLLH